MSENGNNRVQGIIENLEARADYLSETARDTTRPAREVDYLEKQARRVSFYASELVPLADSVTVRGFRVA
jgi:hypothetical protein